MKFFPRILASNSQLQSSLSNKPKEAISLYTQLNRTKTLINTYPLLLCSIRTSTPPLTQQLHTHAFTTAFISSLSIRTALLRSYSLIGDLISAHQLFDETPLRDTIQWNSLIAAYTQNHHPSKAILTAHAMVENQTRPNEITIVSILSACRQARDVVQGKIAHCYAVRNLAWLDSFVCNALIELYGKCGCLVYARRVFDGMGARRNVVSWTSMINVYGDDGSVQDVLGLFGRVVDVRPDEAMVIVLVQACARACGVELAEWVEAYVGRSGFGESVRVVNALIDMHCRCGGLHRACRLFDTMRVRTVVSWTVMIQGLAMHGCGVEALVRFSQMQREGLRPDEIVFLSVLRACSHVGLVVEGKRCFQSMVEEYCLVPWMEHYGGMVDLLCKAGLADEAFEFAVNMPVRADGVIWRMLVGAFREKGDMESARRVVDYLIELEPEQSGNYVLKSNLYAMNGEWGDVREVRNGMRMKGVSKKDPGWSYVEESYNEGCGSSHNPEYTDLSARVSSWIRLNKSC